MELFHIFGHAITSQDLVLVGTLVFLEGILSVDNALVLGVLARRLAPEQRRKALTYGLVGAFVFRFIALGLAVYLVQWRWVKFVGGGYLLWVGISHLFFNKKDDLPGAEPKHAGFWKTVMVIELTDIAFALDSILAAVALTNKFWIILTGGILGIIMMRFAASMFIVMLEKFPQMEKVAYWLVIIIGTKVVVEGLSIPGIDFHDSHAPAFWTFWGLMAGTIAWGFLSNRNRPAGPLGEKAVEIVEQDDAPGGPKQS